MIEIRLAEGGTESTDTVEEEIFTDRFLIKRPLLQALEPDLDGPPVLLIDELDRTDEPFEAFCSKCCRIFRSPFPRSARSRPSIRRSSSSPRTARAKSTTR